MDDRLVRRGCRDNAANLAIEYRLLRGERSRHGRPRRDLDGDDHAAGRRFDNPAEAAQRDLALL